MLIQLYSIETYGERARKIVIHVKLTEHSLKDKTHYKHHNVMRLYISSQINSSYIIYLKST